MVLVFAQSLQGSLSLLAPVVHPSVALRTLPLGRRGSNTRSMSQESDDDVHSSVVRRSSRTRGKAGRTPDLRAPALSAGGKRPAMKRTRSLQRTPSYTHRPLNDRHAATAEAHLRPTPARTTSGLCMPPPGQYRLTPPRITLPPVTECTEASMLSDIGSMVSEEHLVLVPDTDVSCSRPALRRHESSVTQMRAVLFAPQLPSVERFTADPLYF